MQDIPANREQTDALHRTLFNSRIELDKTVKSNRASTKVLHKNSVALADAEVTILLLEEQISTLQAEYNNVVAVNESQQKQYDEHLSALKLSHAEAVAKYEESLKEFIEQPATPAEKLLAYVYDKTVKSIHLEVMYHAAIALNPCRTITEKAMNDFFIERYESDDANMFHTLSVNEKQVVRENIRQYVMDKLTFDKDLSDVGDIFGILEKSKGPKGAWTAFQSRLRNTDSKMLIALVSNREKFDNTANVIVEHILENLK